MAGPLFLDFAVIEDLHRESVKLYGGMEGIRDRNLIESALASAINTHLYGDGNLFDIAATYAFHLAQAQAFLDGNKRTAAGAALMFLRANGISNLPESEKLYALIAIAERRLAKEISQSFFVRRRAPIHKYLPWPRRKK